MISKTLYGVVLFGFSVIPMTGSAHWEGIEAADPTTPPAVLRLDSAAVHYTELNVQPRSWRALFADRDASTTAEPERDADVRGESQRPPAQAQR
jgi:hypothetical protein